MICVIATIDLVPNGREAFLRIFRELAPQVLAEPGCLEYAAMVDLPTGMAAQPAVRPDTVVVVEKWESLAAVEKHLATPHMARFRDETKALRRGLTLHVVGPA